MMDEDIIGGVAAVIVVPDNSGAGEGDVPQATPSQGGIPGGEETSLVPRSVTPRQVRLLLLQQGLLDTVEAIIAQQDRATQIAWEFAIDFRRDDPLLLGIAQTLGLTEQQIDEFFIAASRL